MSKVEYKVIEHNQRTVEEDLNHLAADGWKLVNVFSQIQSLHSFPQPAVLVLERPVRVEW